MERPEEIVVKTQEFKEKEFQQRLEIIFGTTEGYAFLGGTEKFEGLEVQQLQKLVDLELIELDGCQNCSPDTEQFLEFMKDHPEVLAHGYVVHSDRGDARVTLEGLEYHGAVDWKLLKDFACFAHHADEYEYEENHLWCWWD